jgi:hypothetical protein
MVFVAPAYAGIFDFIIDAGRLPMVLPTLFSATQVSNKVNVYYIPVIPTGIDCAPSFTPGNDGVFRRTPYCHKNNPTRARGFLELGSDVPASFLAGFTTDDVLARWKDVRFTNPEFLGSKNEIPTGLLTLLNVQAAQAWEKMLTCANGNADQAREMYRLGKFTCTDEGEILSLLKEIRSSLPALAASLEVPPFFDEDAMNRMETEINQKRSDLPNDWLEKDPEGFFREVNRLEKARLQIADWRFTKSFSQLARMINDFLPKMPRLHPLLAQVMVEDLLTLVKPNESPGSLNQRFKEHPERRAYLTQLVLWINAVEDRDCASFGLWPSASRTALDSLGQSVLETLTPYGNLRTQPRMYVPVICYQAPIVNSSVGWNAPSYIDQAGNLMRLPDLYRENRFTVWRELLDVRERQLDAIKR